MASYSNGFNAVEFKCKSYVLIHDLNAFDQQKGFTIGCWIKWKKPNMLDDDCRMENPGEDPYMTTSADSAYVFAYNDYQDPSGVDGTRLTLSVPNGLAISNSGGSLELKIDLSDKKWHFLMLAFDPAEKQAYQVTAYVDGENAKEGGGSFSLYHDEGFLTPDNKTLGIGCQYSNGGDDENRWRGQMAEFQIWQGILEPQKVQALMNGMPVVADEPALKLFLPLSTVDNNGSNKPFENRVSNTSGRIEYYGFS